MTKRQMEYFDWIKSYISANGLAPSFNEIRLGMGVASLASVHKKIGELVKRGALTYRPEDPRSIHILEPVSGCVSCRRLLRELMISGRRIAQLESMLQPVKISTNAPHSPAVSSDSPVRMHSIR